MPDSCSHSEGGEISEERTGMCRADQNAMHRELPGEGAVAEAREASVLRSYLCMVKPSKLLVYVHYRQPHSADIYRHSFPFVIPTRECSRPENKAMYNTCIL